MTAADMTTPLLDVRALTKLYPVKSGTQQGQLHAVDDVSLAIMPGESVGLVGESGCGKSTLVRLLARLIDPSSGQIRLDGNDLAAMPQTDFVSSPDRRRVQVVFQDPTESLNPSFRVTKAIGDFIYAQSSDGPAVYKFKKASLSDLDLKPADLAAS